MSFASEMSLTPSAFNDTCPVSPLVVQHNGPNHYDSHFWLEN